MHLQTSELTKCLGCAAVAVAVIMAAWWLAPPVYRPYQTLQFDRARFLDSLNSVIRKARKAPNKVSGLLVLDRFMKQYDITLALLQEEKELNDAYTNLLFEWVIRFGTLEPADAQSFEQLSARSRVLSDASTQH